MTQLPSVDLRGLRALVTGGATGIGLAITEALMAHGAGVHACGTKADALDSAKAALPGLGVSVVPREVGQLYVKNGWVSLVQLNNDWAQRQFVILFRSKDELNPAARELLGFLSRAKGV